MNYRDFLQKVIYAIINPLIKAMIAVGITPNIVTFVGFLGNIVAAGFMQRPERVVVTAVTAMITGFTGNIWWLAGGMILIAVLANITAFWRIWHCYVVMNSRK